jgi:hypothetical protein
VAGSRSLGGSDSVPSVRKPTSVKAPAIVCGKCGKCKEAKMS